jgi:glycosyltransferase involved in cell wall biosynthesis
LQCATFHSKLETFGLTVAEAISAGRPVVVTNSGGVQDIVDTSNGIITAFDLDSFANALASIKANYYKYNLKQISQDAKERFGKQTIYAKLYAHYCSCDV